MRMLGRYRIGWCDNPRCCPQHGKVRKRKRAEQRMVRAEPLIDWTPLDDPSDCRHGCNGDCVTSGSELCDFTCHR